MVGWLGQSQQHLQCLQPEQYSHLTAASWEEVLEVPEVLHHPSWLEDVVLPSPHVEYLQAQ